MKRTIFSFLVFFLTVLILSPSLQAQVATREQARAVAAGWIHLIMEKKGDWGGSETAEIVEIREFRRGNRVLGFFFTVEPRGYIVVALRREMAPIKAYSETCDLDPEAEEGMAALIKDRMDAFLARIEKRFGPISRVWARELKDVLEND
jgi:hypothetical protein